MGGRNEAENAGNEAYLLELLDGTLVDTTALVDHVTSLSSTVSETVLSVPRAAPAEASRRGERSIPGDAYWNRGGELTVVDLPESTWPITTTLI